MSEDSSVTRTPTPAKPSVVLIGDGPTALTALRSLVESCHVLGVLRGAGGPADPVRACAAKQGLAVGLLEKTCDLRDVILKLRPQAVVISSFNQILSPDLLALSRFINVHYSPLPRYRGRANVNWAIINGEPAAAISIHLVTAGLDEGNVLFQEQVTIHLNDTAQSLYERLNAIQERELGRAVVRAVAGDAGLPQDQEKATYGCGRVADDGEIDWNDTTHAIDRLIRGLSPPFPGAFTFLDGRRLVIMRAEPRTEAPRYEGRVPGRIVGRSRNEGWVDVLTGDGILRVFDVMPKSSLIAPAAQIIRSTRSTLGLSRPQLLRRISALETRLVALESALRGTGLSVPSAPGKG